MEIEADVSDEWMDGEERKGEEGVIIAIRVDCLASLCKCLACGQIFWRAF